MSHKVRYGGREIGEGDEVEIYFHWDPGKGTYIARSDEGVVIFPERGSRMVPEMMLQKWKIVSAKARVIKVFESRPGRLTVIVRPLEWEGVYK